MQTAVALPPTQEIPGTWRKSMPVLVGRQVVLRQLGASDARSLVTLLAAEEVAQYMSPPPATVAAFERFIAWARAEQAAGRHFAYAITPRRCPETAIGVLQVRRLTLDFHAAEWGFALGCAYWGTGAFVEAARLTVDFAFDVVGVHRLEARAAVANTRGHAALAKVGAVKECVLRSSFLKGGRYLDQVLWSIVRDDWERRKAVWGSTVQ